MLGDIDLWIRVSGDAALLERAAAVDPSDVASVASLRRIASVEAAAVAIALVSARAKSAHKFLKRGDGLIADVAGVEQASGGAVAAYKAKRMAEALGPSAAIADLCCGIGGDSMALTDRGLSVVSVDRAPVRAWMTRQNTGGRCHVVCADVEALALRGMPLHLDPARRDEAAGRRAWRIDDYRPGPAVIGRLLSDAPAAALKLSPGVDIDALPWPGELCLISERGRLVQAVLWTGSFARSPRSAVLIDADTTHILCGEPTEPPVGPAERYVYTFDAGIERAGLIGLFCETVDAPAIHPRLGLLTSDRVIDSPWLKGFALVERMPWRPKRVKQWLAGNDGGLVEVKTRGKACDPNREQARLRGKGGSTYTVFVLRFDTKVETLITKRL